MLKEAKKLPWEERLLHKNWKVRNDANIDLAAVCDSITDPKDPRLRDFGNGSLPVGSGLIYSFLVGRFGGDPSDPAATLSVDLPMHVDSYIVLVV